MIQPKRMADLMRSHFRNIHAAGTAIGSPGKGLAVKGQAHIGNFAIAAPTHKRKQAGHSQGA